MSKRCIRHDSSMRMMNPLACWWCRANMPSTQPKTILRRYNGTVGRIWWNSSISSCGNWRGKGDIVASYSLHRQIGKMIIMVLVVNRRRMSKPEAASVASCIMISLHTCIWILQWISINSSWIVITREEVSASSNLDMTSHSFLTLHFMEINEKKREKLLPQFSSLKYKAGSRAWKRKATLRSVVS